MKVFTKVADLKEALAQERQAGKKIGLVPTMGNLHEGHLSLVDKALELSDRVVVSIFVNPLQFGEGEDFDTYPRTLEEDVAKLADSRIWIFAPSVAEVYPTGRGATQILASPALANVLEGAARPRHFDGVCTVVAKLFNLVEPDLAVFGQKDFQQVRVLQQMVADLNFPLELHLGAIARDADGLALSSRNQYLSPEHRAIAPKLFVALTQIEMSVKSGNLNITELIETAKKQLLLEGFDKVDYLQVGGYEDLLPVTQLELGKKYILLSAAYLDTTRLLDNILLCP